MIPFVMLFLVDVTDGLFAEIIRYCYHCKLYSGNKNDYSYLHSE